MDREIVNRYQIRVTPLSDEDGGGYEAVFGELGRMVAGYGETQPAAIDDLLGAVPLLLDSLAEDGESVPEPLPATEWKDYSGRVTLRLPKHLHYQLDQLAQAEGVSLNSLMTSLLQWGTVAVQGEAPAKSQTTPVPNKHRAVG